MSGSPPTPPPPPAQPAQPPVPDANPPGRPAYPTGTVALVFTDIQGSTSLWEKLGDKFASVLELHNRLMREAIDENRGHEVKTVGDAFMIAFQDPLDAVKFAIDALETLAVTAWPETTGELMVRVGVHTGEPIVDVDRGGRVDYFGPVVNCAARIESAAHGGQILIGRTTQAAVAERLKGVELADLGEHRLKGIDSPERIFQVISPRVPHQKFPPIATLTSLPTNLPYQQTSFIGREKELSEVTTLLAEPETRLVTITGPGGTGKTRFSLRTGNLMLDQFVGGVWVANLARARTVEDIAAAVAQALGLQLGGGESPEKLVANVLEYRKPLLLILDNFEQVVEHAPATVGLWMSRAPKAKFLVTSQAVLGLGGEYEYRLASLSSPPRASERSVIDVPTHATALSYDSVRLFVERAREVSPGFRLNGNAADIMTICAELEGIPLALELAAARVRIMTPSQMVQRLSQTFQLLRSTRRDLPERHQTLQAAIQWSYDLLADWEKACFQQACVFRGGFSLEAAEAIIDLSEFPDAPFPMDAVQMLREKSLLTTRETPFGTRFHMFRSMREFGEAQWQPTEALQLRHAQYYARYAMEWEGKRIGPEMLLALDRLGQKKDNIVSAIERMLALKRPTEAAELALAFAGYLMARGIGKQRTAPLEEVLQAINAAPDAVDNALRVRIMAALSRAYETLGDYRSAELHAVAASEAAATLGAGIESAEATTQLAEARHRAGKLEEALKLYHHAEEMYSRAGDKLGLARNLGAHAMALIIRNDLDGALQCLDQAEAINRERHNTMGLIANLSNQGRLSRLRGAFDRAAAQFMEAESLSRKVGDAVSCARVLGNRAIALQEKGDTDAALGCHAEAERLFREMGDKVNATRVVGNCGESLFRQGKYAEALSCYDQVLPVMREVRQKRSIGAFAANRAWALVELDRGEEALGSADEAIASLREVGALYTYDSFIAHSMRARALAKAPQPGRKARDDARVALQLAGFLKVHEQAPNRNLLALLNQVSALA